MNFLFHTALILNDRLVYYNIYKNGQDTFYAEVLDNPDKVVSAKDFKIYRKDNQWVTDDQCFSRKVDEIMGLIEGVTAFT